jgi:Cu(I)/Ag(I) efflux system membrane fusion protein
MKKFTVAVVILSVAALSFWAGGKYGVGSFSGSGSPRERQVLYYVDPMTPGFRSDKPGIAPCGMPLEPVYAETDERQEDNATGWASTSHGAVKISPYRQQLIGVKVAAVEEKPMTYTLRLYGRVVSDETKVYRINASTDSWIRELSDVTTGSIVDKNQILAEGLAPAYYNAQVTYLIAVNNIDRIREQLGGQLRHQQGELADRQIRVAVQTLQNLGVTDAQIEELANTRKAQPYLQMRSPVRGVVLNRELTLYQWFKAGEEFYTVADIGQVWVYADVYEDEAWQLGPGMTVEIRHTQMNQTFSAKVGEVLPLFDPVSKTLKVQLVVDNPQYDLRPDMFVDVNIPITMPPSLHVPADAVIDSGTSSVVYVNVGSGAFEPRKVTTGWRLGRQVEITDGLMPGEKIVVSGNFLIDSESRMRTAASRMEHTMSKDPVCGMSVDEGKAVTSGMLAAYGNKTFYFCMDRCKKEFEKEPENYVGKELTDQKQATHAVMSRLGRSWADLLEPVKDRRGGTASKKKIKNTPGRTASDTGIIDWDGDAPPSEWRRGWGGFPGAEYLGLKPGPFDKSTQPSEARAAGGKNTTDVDRGISDLAPTPDPPDIEMEHQIEEQPISDRFQPSVKQ